MSNYGNIWFNIQGVRKFLPQLCQALASSYVVTMKYPFNHVILTSRDFFWHMKHLCTLIGSWVTIGNSFWQDFHKTEFSPFLPYPIKMKFCNCSAASSHWYLKTIKIVSKMIALSSIRLIQGIFGYFIFLLGSQTGERLSFAEMLQKLFPSITD